jgi:hypothetical protein
MCSVYNRCTVDLAYSNTPSIVSCRIATEDVLRPWTNTSAHVHHAAVVAAHVHHAAVVVRATTSTTTHHDTTIAVIIVLGSNSVFLPISNSISISSVVVLLQVSWCRRCCGC